MVELGQKGEDPPPHPHTPLCLPFHLVGIDLEQPDDMVDLLLGVVEAQHLGEVAHDVVLAGRPVGGVTRGPRAGREEVVNE